MACLHGWLAFPCLAPAPAPGLLCDGEVPDGSSLVALVSRGPENAPSPNSRQSSRVPFRRGFSKLGSPASLRLASPGALSHFVSSFVASLLGRDWRSLAWLAVGTVFPHSRLGHLGDMIRHLQVTFTQPKSMRHVAEAAALLDLPQQNRPPFPNRGSLGAKTWIATLPTPPHLELSGKFPRPAPETRTFPSTSGNHHPLQYARTAFV